MGSRGSARLRGLSLQARNLPLPPRQREGEREKEDSLQIRCYIHWAPMAVEDSRACAHHWYFRQQTLACTLHTAHRRVFVLDPARRSRSGPLLLLTREDLRWRKRARNSSEGRLFIGLKKKRRYQCLCACVCARATAGRDRGPVSRLNCNHWHLQIPMI